MLPNGAKLHYQHDPTNPRVYSVGDDATNDGGSDAPNALYLANTARKAGGQVRYVVPPGYSHYFDADDAPPTDWDCRDTVYHLTRQLRYQPQGQLEWQHEPLPD
jgi:hypothetical protein